MASGTVRLQRRMGRIIFSCAEKIRALASAWPYGIFRSRRGRIAAVLAHYPVLLERLRQEAVKRPIRVAFLVSENSKWGYQSTYDLLAASDRFEPFILLTVDRSVHTGRDSSSTSIMEENVAFFRHGGMTAYEAYDSVKRSYIPLKRFAPDVVFYQQPWDMAVCQSPLAVSRYALCCYVPYALQIFAHNNSYTEKFHALLFRYFLPAACQIDFYERQHAGNGDNCVAVGYPKLDSYITCDAAAAEGMWRQPDKIKVIYAPHHAFEKDGLRFATFTWNGKEILELAKAHPETTWIFKPHPRFRFAVVKNGIMTESEVDSYYREWEKIGHIYDRGDYLGLFKSSDAMLTDCGSFLGEYLPSNRPLINMRNSDATPFNAFGEEVTKHLYKVFDMNELLAAFQRVVLDGDDFMKDARNGDVKLVADPGCGAGQAIFEQLERDLGMKQ